MHNLKKNFISSKALNYFLQLTETMNYTKTAQILGISQPALTQQIKKLEHNVGAPLFYNVGKKLHLSDAGYTLLDATHQIYETVSKATDQIQRSSEINQGTIDIGILSSIETNVFTDFAIQYYKKHREVQLSFRFLTRKEMWDKLENNEIDLGIMYLPDTSIRNWKPYVSKRIIKDELLFLNCNDRLKNKKKITLKETLSEPWVTYPQNYYLNHVIKEYYKKAAYDTPEGIAYFTQARQIYYFSKSLGISATLPASFVLAYNIGKDRMNSASFDPKIEFDMSFIYRRGKELIPRINSFLTDFDNYLDRKDYVSRLIDLVKGHICRN